MPNDDQTTSQVGLTRDAGWQIGIRRTLPHPAAAVWDVLTSDAGRALWLGSEALLPSEPNDPYRTSDGTTGELRSLTTGRVIRLTWRPAGWPTPSTLQIRLIPAASGTTLSIHHEHLHTGDRREAMRSHWTKVMDGLEAMLRQAPEPG